MSLAIQVDNKAANKNKAFLRRFIPNKNRWKTVVKKNSFANNEYFSWSQCVKKNKCYKLTMIDRRRDGICCEHGYGFLELELNGQTEYSTFEDGRILELFIGNCDLSNKIVDLDLDDDNDDDFSDENEDALSQDDSENVDNVEIVEDKVVEPVEIAPEESGLNEWLHERLDKVRDFIQDWVESIVDIFD